MLSRVATAWYFFHFLVVLPNLGWLERPLPLPESISRAVLGPRGESHPGGGPIPAGAAAAKPMEKA